MSDIYRRRITQVRAFQWRGGNEAEIITAVGPDVFEALDKPCDDDPEATAAVRDDRRGGTWALMLDGDWVVQWCNGWTRMGRDEFAIEFEAVP